MHDLGDVESVVLERGEARLLHRRVAAAGVEALPGRAVEDHVRRRVGALERHHRAGQPGREVDGIGPGLRGGRLDRGGGRLARERTRPAELPWPPVGICSTTGVARLAAALPPTPTGTMSPITVSPESACLMTTLVVLDVAAEQVQRRAVAPDRAGARPPRAERTS